MKPSSGTRRRHSSRSRQWPPTGERYTPPVRIRSTGGTFSISGITSRSRQASAKKRRKRSISRSSGPSGLARYSSGDIGVKRWIVSTGDPMPAANSTLLSMPRRASSSRRSTRTNAPLGQATGDSAVTTRSPAPIRVTSIAWASEDSSATWGGISASSSPCHGPPARRSATWSGSGAALSSGMAAKPVDIELYGGVEGPGFEDQPGAGVVTLVLAGSKNPSRGLDRR